LFVQKTITTKIELEFGAVKFRQMLAKNAKIKTLRNKATVLTTFFGMFSKIGT